jgi:hypothetical protein
MHRLKKTTFEIITDDKLNYDLMLFGVDHSKKNCIQIFNQIHLHIENQILITKDFAVH